MGAALGRHTLVRGGQGADRAPRQCMPTSSSAQSPALSRRASACPWAEAGDAQEGQARLWQPSAGHKWTQVMVYTTAVRQQHPGRSPRCWRCWFERAGSVCQSSKQLPCESTLWAETATCQFVGGSSASCTPLLPPGMLLLEAPANRAAIAAHCLGVLSGSGLAEPSSPSKPPLPTEVSL